METAKVDLKPGGRVRIIHVGGDLRLTGTDTNRLEAQAGRRGGLRAKARDNVVEVTSASGCLVFLPADCPVEIGTIGGDGRITDMTAMVAVGSVGGDLKLRRLSDVAVDHVGGDLLAQRLQGRLVVKALGGDAQVEKIDGEVDLGSVGGDLRVRSLVGSIHARVEGDAGLGLSPAPGSRSSVRAGGDLACRVPPDASARAMLSAQGELKVAVDGDTSPEGRTATVVLGTGDAELELQAGGDLALLRGAEVEASDLPGSITAEVESALEHAATEVDAALGAGTFEAGAIGERVREALQAGLSATTGQSDPHRDRSDDGLSAERALVLKMVADGLISAEEADRLLQAMEGQP